MKSIVLDWFSKKDIVPNISTKFDHITSGNIQACLEIFPDPSSHLNQEDFEYMFTLWQDIQQSLKTHSTDKEALYETLQNIVDVCNDSCEHLNGIWMTLRENQEEMYRMMENI